VKNTYACSAQQVIMNFDNELFRPLESRQRNRLGPTDILLLQNR
jgi:hypothetical protein